MIRKTDSVSLYSDSTRIILLESAEYCGFEAYFSLTDAHIVKYVVTVVCTVYSTVR